MGFPREYQITVRRATGISMEADEDRGHRKIAVAFVLKETDELSVNN
jgi:hypothetical protein